MARERLALQHARRATALDDRAWLAWGVLAQLGYSRRNYPLTIQYARKALALHPVHGLYWYVLTQAYRFLGRLDEALKAIKVGIRYVKRVDPVIRDLMWRELEICYRRNRKHAAACYLRSQVLDDIDFTTERERIVELVQMLDSLDAPKASDAKQALEQGENSK
jgi:tetratricopeptide (TPR) repeat protein